MRGYKLKTGRLEERLVNTYKGIEDRFTDAFLEEDGSLKTGGMAEKVTSAYRKVEDAVVGGYRKVEDAFVDAFLEKRRTAKPLHLQTPTANNHDRGRAPGPHIPCLRAKGATPSGGEKT